MADERRPPSEVKDMGIKRMKECYEKSTGGACPPSKIKEFEKHFEKKVLPKIYDSEK